MTTQVKLEGIMPSDTFFLTKEAKIYNAECLQKYTTLKRVKLTNGSKKTGQLHVKE